MNLPVDQYLLDPPYHHEVLGILVILGVLQFLGILAGRLIHEAPKIPNLKHFIFIYSIIISFPFQFSPVPRHLLAPL